jgi:hypothetical protein
VDVDLAEYIKMARIDRYSSMSDKEKLYEDLRRKRSTTSGRRRRTSDTPVMAGPRVDRTPEAPTAAELREEQDIRRNERLQRLAKAPKKVARARFGEGPSKTIIHKGKPLANVSATQLKKTGMSLNKYLNAWNKTGKRPTAKKKEPEMTRVEAREAGITGGRVLSRAGARKAGITGPQLPEVKKVPSPVKRAITAPTAARRATAEGRRRNLIQQASAQGFSKGGAVNKSRGTGAAETGTGFQGVF